MWWLYMLIPVIIAVLFYGYSIKDSIKVAKPGCSSCPVQKEGSFQMPN